MLELSVTSLAYRIPALLVALSVHEFGHAIVSDSLGDPTPRMEGRLTLNPLAHLSKLGTIMLLIFGFGWANPVPVNPIYYKNPRNGMFLVGIAGIVMNLLVALVSVFISATMDIAGFLKEGGATLLFWIMTYNTWLAFFNILPIWPMDGFRVVSAFLPYDLSLRFEQFLAKYGFIILMLLVFTDIVDEIVSPLAGTYLYYCREVIYSLLL